MKAIADCVESIIGAFFEEFGEQATVVLLQRMNIIPVTQFPLQSFMEASSESAEGVPLRECQGTEGDATDEPKSNLSLERLERRLGYTMQGTVPAVGARYQPRLFFLVFYTGVCTTPSSTSS